MQLRCEGLLLRSRCSFLSLARVPSLRSDSGSAGTQVLDQSNLIAACLRAGTVKRFLPSEYNVDISSAQSEVPDIFGPRAAILEELQESQIPYTLICSNGFMEYWNAGTFLTQLEAVRRAALFLSSPKCFALAKSQHPVCCRLGSACCLSTRSCPCLW